MNTLYSFNDAYASIAGISILSLLENNAEEKEINIYIVDSGIAEGNRKKIKELVSKYNKKVEFLSMPNFGKQEIDARRWNINVFSKLFIASLLPESITKIISIDCDTVIRHSIGGLWNTDLDGYVLAGVNEGMSKYYRRNLDKGDKDYYLNSGLLLLNLAIVREQKYEEKFFECMQIYGSSLAYLDQDVINAIVPQNKIRLLALKYNCITPVCCMAYKDFIKARRASTYYCENEFNKAKEDPYIVHYTTFFYNNLRPWFEGSTHPRVEEFLKYKSMSPWALENLKQDNRSKLTKFKGKLVHIFPKGLVVSVAAIVHGVFLPIRNNKKMKIARNNSTR